MRGAGKSLVPITLMAGFASAALAQVPFNKPELAIKYRQSAMFIQGQHFNYIGAVVKGELIKHAMLVEEMAKTYWDGFPPATERATNTKAREEIWKEPERFRAAGQKTHEEIVKLVSAIRDDDFGAIKSQFGAVGRSCKSCHDDFKRN
jgi:cytochrome c556